MTAPLLLSISLCASTPGPRLVATTTADPGLHFGSAQHTSWVVAPESDATQDNDGPAVDSSDDVESPEPSADADEPAESADDTDDTDDAEPEGEPPVVTAEPEEPTDDPSLETGTSESDTEADASGEPGLDDIFGTSEDHTDIEVVSDSDGGTPTEGTTTDAPTSTPAPPRPHWTDKLDTRIRIVTSAYYDTARVEKRGFGRQENRLEFYFSYTANEHIQIVGDIEPVFFGVAQVNELGDLASRQLLTPFHVESDAAYVAFNDVLPNLDIKIGRQTLVWGTADKFNPTNNINPDDLEDRPLFTEPIANQMVVVDYAPLGDKLWFQGVYVPVFYPALLPPSAAAALKDPQAPVPFAREEDNAQLDALQSLLAINPRLVPEVSTTIKVPRTRFTNGQSAAKIGTTLGGVDMSFSYYNGRHDIPLPVLVESETKEPAEGDGAECCYSSHVTLVYPRMQVIGADFSTQLGFLRDMGLWGEGAMFLPQANELLIEFPIPVDVTPSGQANDDGVANPVSSMQGPTIRSRPFVKATGGLDFSFGKHVYVQGQYLRGFIDEFGSGHIGNYLVGGTDLIFFGRHLIFRMFGVVDLPTGRGDEGSYVLYPELILVPPWGSVTVELGSFFMLGGKDTKFGQPAAGSSMAFLKVVGQF